MHKFITCATAEHKDMNLMCERSLGGKGWYVLTPTNSRVSRHYLKRSEVLKRCDV